MSGWDELAESLGSRPSASRRTKVDGRRDRPRRPILCDECIRFLSIHSAFEDQREAGSMAREHIDGCEACQQYFVWKEWNRKREEAFYTSPEVVGLVEEYAKRFQLPFWQRRKVHVAAAILAVLLVLTALGVFAVRSLRAAGVSGGPAASFMGVLGVGIDAWFGGSGPRPVGTGGSPTPNADRHVRDANTRLDRMFNHGGAPAISGHLVGASELETLRVLRWISMRGQTAMIPTVVSLLSDPRLTIRNGATGTLAILPPIPIKPYVQSIRQAAASETNARLRGSLERLAKKVDGA